MARARTKSKGGSGAAGASGWQKAKGIAGMLLGLATAAGPPPVTSDAVQRDIDAAAAETAATFTARPGKRAAITPPGVYLGQETTDPRAILEAYENLRVQMARVSGAAFNEYVLRTELTNEPVRNGRHQEEWHQLIDQHRNLILISHIESGKTAAITLGRTLFELGRNPGIRIAIVSETYSKAQKVLRAIKRYIEDSEELHRVFPHLRKTLVKGEPWNDKSIAVERPGIIRDPSVVVTGAGGSIQGARIEIVILDDILSFRNTRTEQQRTKLLEWFKADIAGRLTKDARVIAVGTAWHPEDLYHTLGLLDGWVTYRYGVLGADGQPMWPEVWPLDRIRDAEKRLGHVEANRQLHVIPVTDAEQWCKDEYIERSYKEGFGLSVARSLAELLGPGEKLPPGCFLTTGIDVAASLRKKSGGALTVAATVLHYPNGDHQVVCVEAGRLTGPEILNLARSHHQLFGSTVFVEDNGAQRFLLQFAQQGEYFPVLPHHTGANKWDPRFGVTSVFVEMANGKWLFPCEENRDRTRVVDKELLALVQEMRSFAPDKHTGDRLMSLWIAREGARWYRGTGVAAQVEAAEKAREEREAREARGALVDEDDDEDDESDWS